MIARQGDIEGKKLLAKRIAHVKRRLTKQLNLESPTKQEANPMTSTTKLEQLLDELVRPALRAHGGDAELVSFQDGILRLRMLGQCAGCPAATMTNETLIEGQLMPLLPDLKEVILVHTVDDSLLAQARAMMQRARAHDQG